MEANSSTTAAGHHQYAPPHPQTLHPQHSQRLQYPQPYPLQPQYQQSHPLHLPTPQQSSQPHAQQSHYPTPPTYPPTPSPSSQPQYRLLPPGLPPPTFTRCIPPSTPPAPATAPPLLRQPPPPPQQQQYASPKDPNTVLSSPNTMGISSLPSLSSPRPPATPLAPAPALGPPALPLHIKLEADNSSPAKPTGPLMTINRPPISQQATPSPAVQVKRELNAEASNQIKVKLEPGVAVKVKAEPYVKVEQERGTGISSGAVQPSTGPVALALSTANSVLGNPSKKVAQRRQTAGAKRGAESLVKGEQLGGSQQGGVPPPAKKPKTPRVTKANRSAAAASAAPGGVQGVGGGGGGVDVVGGDMWSLADQGEDPSDEFDPEGYLRPCGGSGRLVTKLCNRRVRMVVEPNGTVLLSGTLENVRPLLTRILKFTEVAGRRYWSSGSPLTERERDYVIQVMKNMTPKVESNADVLKPLPKGRVPPRFRPLNLKTGKPITCFKTTSENGMGFAHNFGRQYFCDGKATANNRGGFVWADGTLPRSAESKKRAAAAVDPMFAFAFGFGF